MSRTPGTIVERDEWCDACGLWTKQCSEVLTPVAGVRHAFSEWGCLSCFGPCANGPDAGREPPK